LSRNGNQNFRASRSVETERDIVSPEDYMTHNRRSAVLRVVTCVAWCAALLSASARMQIASAEFEAGVAEVDITAPIGTPLAGYGARWGRPSTGIHDPVYARALYLSDGKTAAVIVASDLIGIMKTLRDRVLSYLPTDLGVPQRNILLSATHTHASQGAMTNLLLAKIATGRYDEDVFDTTARNLAKVIVEAVRTSKPAAFGYGTGTNNKLSYNRAHRDGPIDPVITVIRIDDVNGKPTAILANFTAHPTVLSARNMLFSADYPGYFAYHLEQRYDNTVVAMFTNGAEGDQGPGNPENNSGFARAESIGKLLAEDVKKIADQIQTTDNVTLHVGYNEPELPPSVFGRVLQHPRTIVQTIEINDLLLMAVPGEMCVEIGLNLKKRARDLGYAHAAIVGLANDHLGYFVPRSYFDRQYYETEMNFYGPRIEDFLYREVMSLPSRARAAPQQERSPKSITPEVAEHDGIRHLVVEGDPYELGYAHGAAMRESIREVVDALLYDEPSRRPELLLPASVARRIPRFLDITPLYLPFVATRARPMNRFVDERFRLELEALSNATGVSYDELFLANTFFTITAQSDKGHAARLPMCTLVAALGPATKSRQLLVGRNLDLDTKLPFVGRTSVVEFRPRDGLRFISVAWPGSVGVFTAMNEKGVVVAAEGVAAEKTTLDGVPITFLLRKVIQDAASLSEAVTMIQDAPTTCAYNVLVGDGGRGEVRIVEVGHGRSSVRPAHDGLAFGQEPGEGDAGTKYARAKAMLQSAAPDIDVRKVKDILKHRGETGVWARKTIYSVVLEPAAGTVYVAQPDPKGTPGEYAEFSMEMNLETEG